ncbi:MAG TPA: hypothetical protein VGE21_05030 [Flavobacteriales bacterium]
MTPNTSSRGRHRRVRDKSWRSLWRRSSGEHRGFIALLVLIGAGLRIHQAAQPITYAEAEAFVSLSSKPWGSIITDQHAISGHIAHALLVKCSTGLFGVSLGALRLPALLAGILALPLFHLLVRSLFNRHIALMALALAAASGPLVELSAVARGFSLTWVFLLLMLHDGRTYAVTERARPLQRMSLWCALGMWCTPAMIFPALLAYAWVMFHIVRTYESTTRRRNLRVLLSLLLAGCLTALLYIPVLAVHGLDPVISEPGSEPRTWAAFTATQQEGAFHLWAWFAGATSMAIALVGWLGVFHAVKLSGRYRDLVLAMGLTAVLVTFFLLHLGPPEVWVYTIFIFHLSTAISLFYVLKFMQDKLFGGFDERRRTLLACVLLVAVFAPLGLRGIHDRIPRFPEAAQAADWFLPRLKAQDRVLVALPWDSPIEFHFRSAGIDPRILHQVPTPESRIYVLVGTAKDQTAQLVLDRFAYQGLHAHHFVKVEDWRRLEIFAAQ